MKKKVFQNRRGSVLVAILLILFMISVIAISLIKRSAVSLDVSILSKKSSNEYQLADGLAERMLLGIRELDDLSSTNKAQLEEINFFDLCNCVEGGNCASEIFPENAGASSLVGSDNFCEKYEVQFFRYDEDVPEGEVLVAESNYDDVDSNISLLTKIEISSKSDSSVQRAISVSAPRRFNKSVVLDPYLCVDGDGICATDFLTYCGDICYRFNFLVSEVTDSLDIGEEIAGVNIIRETSTDRQPIKFDLASSDETDDFDILNYDEDNRQCHFYLGSKTDDSSGSTIDAGEGDISFRIRSNVNYQFDSLDHILEESSGVPTFTF